jgi:2-alkyl-3-oxoalkanoate reductase
MKAIASAVAFIFFVRFNSNLVRLPAVVATTGDCDMRIFVAGATGAIGHHLVPALTAAGHSVAGLTRHAEKAEMVKRMGAEPVVADALDAEAINTVFHSFQPEIVIHQMTALHGMMDLTHFDRSFAATNRLRTEGTDLLLAAAREVGATRFIAQSFCGWTLARDGGPVKSESDPLDPDPPTEFRRTLEAIKYLERTVTSSTGPEGVVLRYGSFYGPATGVFEPAVIEQIRRRRMPVIGDGGGWWSFLHVEDAASATLAAIDRAVVGHVYNIVDDDPAEVREWLPALATMLGAKPPRHVPAWIGRLLAGEHLVTMMTQVRAGSNAKAKQDLDWQPAHASWRTGFVDVLRQQEQCSAA